MAYAEQPARNVWCLPRICVVHHLRNFDNSHGAVRLELRNDRCTKDHPVLCRRYIHLTGHPRVVGVPQTGACRSSTVVHCLRYYP